ncbi:hypothetical protein MUP06_00750 [Patescibacteria group bacterium]|nr:hypothetical protein [Patescibacteria group bacterium]
MKNDNKSVLSRFFEQLSVGEQEIIKDYLNEKSLGSLSKSFDKLIEGQANEAQAD